MSPCQQQWWTTLVEVAQTKIWGAVLAALSLCKLNTQNAQLPPTRTYEPHDALMPGLSALQGHGQLLSEAAAVSFVFLPWSNQDLLGISLGFQNHVIGYYGGLLGDQHMMS
jgi:hypothetical protein